MLSISLDARNVNFVGKSEFLFVLQRGQIARSGNFPLGLPRIERSTRILRVGFDDVAFYISLVSFYRRPIG